MFQIDIVQKCKANDRKAQIKLYRQYCDSMFNVAIRYVKNSDDAEDVVQEAFIKAFQKIDQFKGDVTFGAWLKRIVVNRCLDFLKVKRHPSITLDERHIQIVEDEDWTVEEGITTADIRTKIEHLPDKYKYVVMMYLIEGFDHREISQVLQLTETTCRTRLLRGKAYLRKLLKEEKYGTGY